jgi:fructose-bisphosphate aldolase/2-amino-3,7-dideoxy-D-threo-hept-6-ulosonate synthase
MHPGLKTRYDRIINPQTGKTVLLPFDHGLPFGPLPGITDPRQTVRWAVAGGANAVIFNQGLAGALFSEYNNKIPTIHMLTNSCTVEHAALFGSVVRAVKWAADGVALEVLVGAETERQMIEQVAPVLDACEEWNMPSLFMMYPTERYVEQVGRGEAIRRAARAGAELGATIVKTAWPGSQADLVRVVESCPAPLVVAGGSQKTIEATFQMTRDIIAAGAIGVAMGRNLWGVENPVKMIRAVSAIVHEDASVAEAMALLEAAPN